MKKCQKCNGLGVFSIKYKPNSQCDMCGGAGVIREAEKEKRVVQLVVDVAGTPEDVEALKRAVSKAVHLNSVGALDVKTSWSLKEYSDITGISQEDLQS